MTDRNNVVCTAQFYRIEWRVEQGCYTEHPTPADSPRPGVIGCVAWKHLVAGEIQLSRSGKWRFRLRGAEPWVDPGIDVSSEVALGNDLVLAKLAALRALPDPSSLDAYGCIEHDA